MRKIGIGLIGVGRHGRRYLHHLIGDVPHAELAALCRKRVGETLDLALADVPVYGDYRALVAHPAVDAVVVVTAPSLCHTMALAAIEAGKPILVEKPLATTGKEARAMVEAAERAHLVMMTAHTMRFDPTVLLVKEWLPSLGRLREAVFTSHIEWSSSLVERTETPVGAMLEFGVHLFDLIRFLSGQEVAGVSCIMDRPRSAGETTAQACLETDGGIKCSLDIARVNSGRVGSMEWRGDGGAITGDWVRRRVVRRLHDGTLDERVLEPTPTIVAVLTSFVHALRTGTAPSVTGLDGCRAVELADACYRSAAEGGAAVRPDDV
ncbi:MAG TPA: Gfo/Idh/MocA family oxidoreductase [Nitrospira sp.]|nr:Gfo/Idh/MocA family oxidoreductase [Nitrospira sp.]